MTKTTYQASSALAEREACARLVTLVRSRSVRPLEADPPVRAATRDLARKAGMHLWHGGLPPAAPAHRLAASRAGRAVLLETLPVGCPAGAARDCWGSLGGPARLETCVVGAGAAAIQAGDGSPRSSSELERWLDACAAQGAALDRGRLNGAPLLAALADRGEHEALRHAARRVAGGRAGTDRPELCAELLRHARPRVAAANALTPERSAYALSLMVRHAATRTGRHGDAPLTVAQGLCDTLERDTGMKAAEIAEQCLDAGLKEAIGRLPRGRGHQPVESPALAKATLHVLDGVILEHDAQHAAEQGGEGGPTTGRSTFFRGALGDWRDALAGCGAPEATGRQPSHAEAVARAVRAVEDARPETALPPARADGVRPAPATVALLHALRLSTEAVGEAARREAAERRYASARYENTPEGQAALRRALRPRERAAQARA